LSIVHPAFCGRVGKSLVEQAAAAQRKQATSARVA
jgi:hypothetical protein